VREAARIQGFSDDFYFAGTTKTQFRLIGNAVPPPVSFEAASITMRLLEHQK
jgi:DNA (cytosine-5)-methyltransferase 1